MDEEERKLQIRIAQLNAHLQVNLGWTFGLLAATVAFLVFGYQIRNDNFYIAIVTYVVATVSIFLAISWSSRVKKCLKELDELK